MFTDVVGSTRLGNLLGDERMDTVREAHFGRARALIERHDGREIKTIGDSFMVAFRTAVEALDFAVDLHEDTGHPEVRIRAGLHVGPVRIREGDAFGRMVNFTARVESTTEAAEVRTSDAFQRDIDAEKAARHAGLDWSRHVVTVKGFSGDQAVWSVRRPG